MSNFLCLLSKEMQCRQSQYKRKCDVTELANVIIHKVRCLSVQKNNKNEDSTTM